MAPIIVVLFFPTVWKMSVFGVFSVHIFPQLDSLYLVRMGENMDQKNSEYRQFLHSVYNKKRCSKSDRASECMQLYCIFFSFFRTCKIWLNQENAFYFDLYLSFFSLQNELITYSSWQIYQYYKLRKVQVSYVSFISNDLPIYIDK